MVPPDPTRVPRPLFTVRVAETPVPLHTVQVADSGKQKNVGSLVHLPLTAAARHHTFAIV